MPNDFIVFTDDDDERSYCGGKPIPRKNDSMIWSLCEHVYQPDSVTLHKSNLQPNKNSYSREYHHFISK